MRRRLPWFAVAAFLAGADAPLLNAQVDELWTRARQERAAYLDTLRELVSIESGSRDVEGLDRAATLIANRFRALGGQVELVAAGADTYKMEDTPAQIGKSVVATFKGSGAKRILLLAHMDTVYQRGMAASQPYRVEGDRAYGLGIADDKSGVALAIHAVAILKALGNQQYATLTVLINADEEISSPGSRNLITRLGSEHDAVFSCEGAGTDDRVRARRCRPRGRPECAVRTGAPHPADARPVRAVHRHDAQLDDCECRRDPQHYSGVGFGHW
jgi:glutamate carboxypeptidase